MKSNQKKLADFYKSLENIDSINSWKIHRHLNESEKVTGKWKDYLIYERKMLSLNINGGKLTYNVNSTDAEGKIISITFKAKEIEYFKGRLDVTLNTWLKARYSNLLWQETKNNLYGETAIDNYSNLLRNANPDERDSFSNILSAVLHISKNIKKRVEESKALTFEILQKVPDYYKRHILSAILDTDNFFKNVEIEFLAEEIENWINLKNPVQHFANKSTLETGLLLFRKLKKPPEKLYQLLAYNEDLIIDQHPDEKDFVRYTYVGTKANYLKKAKIFDEYDNAMQEYNRLKTTMTLNKVSVQLNDEDSELFNKYLGFKTEHILKYSCDEILAFFSLDEELLVDPKENIEYSKQTIKKSLASLFSLSVFDINVNFKTVSDNEKLEHEIINNYSIAHAIKYYTLFFRVFIEGTLRGKFNYYKIFNFLETQTWYGQKFEKGLKHSEIKSSWLSLLAPGIHNFFCQFEMSVLMNTNKVSNFILAIDSLTLKFEGALRDFIRMTGGNTTTEKKGVMQEQLLEELLENPKIKEFFSERDLGLFKFTFTKNGKNIRNNVAHSFYQYSNYDLQNVSLIFLCFLRLGKYTLEE